MSDAETTTPEYDRLLEAAADYLRSIGASPVVIGGTGHMPGSLPLNHYLTVRWTGTLAPDGEENG